MTTLIYVVIKVNVEHPDDLEEDDLCELIGNDCDYDVEYNHNDIKIMGTELVECRSYA